MVYARSLLAFAFILAAFAATPQTILADPSPCTITPDGSGGWIVACTSNPPSVISPISQTFNGSPDPADSGHLGTVVVSPGDGDNGNPGGSPTLDFFQIGSLSQAIEDSPGTAGAGLFIQSKGANGGNGGDADVCVCGGGNGGSGGAGGNPTVTIEPNLTILTNGSREAGVFVQSAGGNGGNGGDGNGSASAGDGGVGGVGGTVTLTLFSTVVTVGDFSDAVIAQSIGGGGGTGGGGLNFSGGSGGPSENGGDVTVNLGATGGGEPGSIFTYGTQSVGLLAQSIGGYGGVGGSSFNLVSVSGGGGNGGNGGTVNVTTSFDSSITTFGGGSTGLVAQSIGGAGGNGGDGGALFAFGGSGSVGGNGGNVTVRNGATITTNGGGAQGLLAQSIGGGGGNGGAGVGILGLGGSGSSTSPGGNVTVFNTGNITTNSTSASSGGSNPIFGNEAIFAQSIGGGGGNGGTGVGLFSVGGSGGGGGNGGTVSVNNNATLLTHASDSSGIFAQSVGGGGGNGGGSVAASAFVSLAIGGSAGVGGNGSNASVTSSGSISTSGDRSNGIQAQSIGGGGGNGGFAVDAAGGQVGFAIGVGGTAGGGGTGGAVNVSSATAISTGGDNADGILAQSIGGGGGSGGFAVAASGGIGAASFALGGSGGNGGDAGSVTVANLALGTISTGGNNADGILAQSIGGGGGNGGFSVSAAVGAASAGLSVGGEGAGGGDSSGVTLTNAATISTSGNTSDALVAQSIGGGGGNGGFSVGASASLDAGAGLSIGGGGAGGGSALGTVTVNNSGTLSTSGDTSIGLFAQSIGGGGGNGGFSIAGSLSLGPAASAGIGGSGGGGGNGGQVHVTNTGAITTLGSQADALSAQSIGGGGGNGGWSVAGSFGAESGAISIGIGGSGGNGGNGDLVSVTNGPASIFTSGAYSNGINAQSIGGGGGNGGFDVAANITGGASLALGFGGFGGSGGTGGQVDVTNHSNVTTGANGAANYANGILAQSIGGGGGSGGFNVTGSLSQGMAGTFSLGGFGGAGGDSGNVTVINSGAISTNGDFASGISAQSLGGGGGDGGFSVGGVLANASSATLALGGNAGDAGNAGTVSVTNTNSIVAGGNNANGILAQSIGGGGGNGGWSVGAGLSGSGVQLAGSFGGNGGSAGSGNDVTVHNGTANAPVTITTFGASSDGILAQSIGGGGGNGGWTVNASATGDGDGQPDAAKFGMTAFNIGYGTCSVCPGSGGGDANNAGNVNVTSFSAITTHGDNANAIAAQSLGGGGGKGAWTIGATADKTGPAVQIQFGGGGGGGNGAGVTVNSTGTLITNGANSNGILAQSIGGGGGFGGLSATNGLITSIPGLTGLDLGQHGNQGGDAGDVTVTNASNILTHGGNGNGIEAQSIGGGGGEGAWSIQAGLSTESGVANSVLNYALGANGGAGGSAGNVSVTSTAQQIQTLGNKADGILAQSIGGGGGDGGFAINGAFTPGWAVGFSMGGSGGAAGNAGTVNVTNGTQINTNGDLSGGITAQSIGGGGGNGGFAFEGLGATGFTADSAIGGASSGGSNGNTVTVTNSGAIGTLGAGADAILAQSIGGGGGNGGGAMSGAVTTGGSGAFFSLGGNGGSGGAGGQVTVVNTASALATQGDTSAGIVAQSLGGGGGNSGFSIAGGFTGGGGALELAFGRSSGTGGNGSTVSVTSGSQNSTTAIQTTGNFADGILAQSVGGGGGNGGFSIAGGVNNGSTFNLAFGTSGGNGGAGGPVFVTNYSSIGTSGSNSDAIAAQSIGGGGGNGGFSIAAAVRGSDGISGSLSMGGNGGSGAEGGQVQVSNAAALLMTAGDNSNGILAQSIGGGGGNGGFSIGAMGTTGKKNLTLAFGGNGGTGGTGGAVSVNSGSTSGSVTIATGGAFSDGILAQSIGGGGGNGGWTVDGLADAGTSLAFSLGGSGGSGNNASNVVVNNSGIIQTSGMGANGIAAQAIGGGGGSGGFNEAGQLDVANSAGITAQSKFNFGNGGGGGNGANIDVSNTGQITTTGENANGILAQSIGGGGGYGGFSYGTALLGNWGIGLGSSTAGGGIGGAVTVTNSGSIGTSGDNAAGVVAQSIGGGGGDGGFAWSAGVNSNISSPTANVGWALGGNGGNGGSAGDVSVTNSGIISTTGANSAGVIAQSIGGGGGNGGNATVALASATKYFEGFTLALGGNAGTTGSGGTVTVTNNGVIQTTGAFSDGIIAQSIGGGGGNGGNATSVIALAGLDESLAYGGAGGSGGAGGNVTVNNSGSISTTGFGSTPIVAQSIGGGGGTGGSMVSGSPITGGLFGFKLGGSNGGTGASGTVTINNTGTLATGGMFSGDLLIQSVGGGGGIASSAILDSLNTKVNGFMLLGATGGTPGGGTAVSGTNSGQLTTNALGADAMIVQSVGGGGGIGGSDIALNATDATVGGLLFGESGVSGAAGNGAAATLSDDAVAATSGDAADALLAQSISAGGGVGTFAIGGTFSAPSLLLTEGTNLANLGSVDNVNATTSANTLLQTLGFHSEAFAAQSIAGGGGTGTIIIGGNISGTSKIGYTLGATGSGAASTGGTGATVTLSNSAQKIITQGDLSTAILAQSIGGGGGDAAFKLGGTISNAALSGVLGGSQLTAGAGGTVNATNNGYIGESGKGSLGILAQSIGGGGGIGGFDNITGTIPSVAYNMGGSNDSGTIGGAVQITNTGQIVTTGIGDAASVAQSIGGGGGEAGYALNLNLGTAATTLNLLAGGNGGSNDIGGAATLNNSAQIATGGNFAPDLLAQSIGGGGGNGGMFAAGNLTTSGSSNQFKLQLGGSGGTGNDAGTVQLTSTTVTSPSTAAYIANGDQSAALEAQSIGGGGGNESLSFNGAFSTGTPNTALVQIGGTKAGNGNSVTMSNTGSIATGLHTAPGVIEGMFSYGLIGQSIGGGGGNGVLSMDLGVPTSAASVGTINVNVGGKAGGNGNGAAVNITNSAKIQTIGHQAIGIVAQSIGGGGGNGAAVIFGNKTAPPPTQAQYKLNINVGGAGSVGNGGDVTVTNSAPIITEGNSGPSILAQSIGGGGGNGGPVRSFVESHPTQCFTAVPPCSARLVGATVTLGGNGSSGNGGTVTVNNKANLGTGGQDASGIIAQSIGGGGGIAGDSHAGHGDWDIIPNDVPGGTAKSWSINVGGSHSTGNGGNVNVTDSGSIATQGDGSFGILAQSIGGGGGLGGAGLGPPYGGTGTIVAGGSVSSLGSGGAVNVTVNSGAGGTTTISTQGKGAYGIFAQSVGGGGGLIGDTGNGIGKTVIGKGSKLVSSTGSGGNGGAVTVVNNSNITTTGVGSEGIFAQSIGGGGGLLTNYAGTANLGGVAGAVSVTQNGIIQTLGNNSDAIFAQSAGGKGLAGNVSVNVTGMALAFGANADGVTAQSVGGTGNGNISITVNTNAFVQGGTGSGSAGVRIIGGKNNSLNNKGTITTAGSPNAQPQPMSLYETDSGIMGMQQAAGASYQTTSLMTDKTSLLSTFTGSTAYSAGTAVYANAGTLNVNNQGNIYGSMALNGASLNFTNSGTFVSGSQVNLGTGTLSLASGGVMTPGAGGFVASTDIFGNFVQSAGSDYLVNLDLTSNAVSRLNVSGTASLSGSIDLDLLSTNAAAPGSHSDTIVTAGSGLTNNGVALAPPKSAVATFNLGYLPNALLLNYDVNYAPQTGRVLNANDLSFGNYIGAIQSAGSSARLASFMSDLFGVPTIPKLKSFYDRFTPAASAVLGSSTLLSNLQFSDEMLRCRVNGLLTEGGNCSWARLGAQSSHETASFTSAGYGHSTSGIAAGFEHRIGTGNTLLGAAIHYSRDALFDGDNATSVSGNGLEAGVSASRVLKNGLVLSADLLGGQGHYNSVRQLSYPSEVTRASGTQAISYIGTHLRAEQRFGGQIKAVTPFVDFGLTRVNVGTLFESGAGSFNAHVAPYHTLYPTLTGGVRLEDSRHLHTTVLHGALDLWMTQIVGNPQSSTTAVLAGAPAAVAPFTISNTLDRTQFDIGPSLEISRGDKASVRIGATYNFSRHNHSGGAYIEVGTKI